MKHSETSPASSERHSRREEGLSVTTPNPVSSDLLGFRALHARSMRRWLFVFFLVSGFSSLVYEVVWIRLSMAAFGVTTPFVSIVISVFMGGLAVGSFAAGRIAGRAEGRPPGRFLRLYALAEAAYLVTPKLQIVGRYDLGYESYAWSGISQRDPNNANGTRKDLQHTFSIGAQLWF